MQGSPPERMTKFHARNKMSKDEWLICIEEGDEEPTKKQRIAKVPSMLQEVESNKKCYDPLVVSIGPYHHGKKELEAVEQLKFKFANQFRLACGDRVSSMNQLYEEVAKVVHCARECYEEDSTTKYDDESFTKMMFLDACFVLQFMCILTKAETKEEDQLPTMKSYLCAFVWRDLFLLENQIPLLVLKVLLKFRFRGDTNLIKDFINLATSIKPPEKSSCTNLVKKFVNECCLGGQTNDERELQLDGNPHLLDLMRTHLIGPPNFEDIIIKKSDQWNSYRSVTELEEAGIHFKASKTHCVTDVTFKDHLVYGTMMLPPLVVDDTTKPLLLNLVAYEMSPNGPHDSLITSYVWLMDSLIDHANDVKELRKKGILNNNLGSDEHLATLFNEIANGLVPDPSAYALAKCQIETHCKNKCRFWIAEWMHKHFSSPWTVLAFLAAIFALALSTGQTYFSVFPRS
ncbi:putative UPF0481 protein At3g02645 [Olea europaea var. sylvestris]|uniref:Uncharacterized protein n=1 Tax=Olea europaea subsp. europaea TaxID=158383 RepID=A0A8S0U428_OLEEU|nr:putative UPF0481 protein At3g02645 [Olea europaea var. sylvestris]CAA3013424.1 Hypothetical predicted protein [Olea europaea subsp. europaea]